MEEKEQTIGKRIKELRTQKLHMSQVDFADIIHVSKQTLLSLIHICKKSGLMIQYSC